MALLTSPSLKCISMSIQPYFSPPLFDFLKRLKRNNRRDWFEWHRGEYESLVLGPAVRFIEDFAPHLYRITPHLVADARPYSRNISGNGFTL